MRPPEIDEEFAAPSPLVNAYGVVKASGAKGDTVVSHRDYLADANFLVALAGDSRFLVELNSALAKPNWPLFLGRKSFIPGMPIQIRHECLENNGLLDDDDPWSALVRFPWIAPRRWIEQRDRFNRGELGQPPEPERLRLVVETENRDQADGQSTDKWLTRNES